MSIIYVQLLIRKIIISTEFQGENMKEKIKELKIKIQELKIKIQKIVYKIKKKIYDLKYRRVTYIPEKGVWVSTVVFPENIASGIYGVTDIFPGSKNKVDFEPLYSVYIKNVSDAVNIHRDMVKCVESGYILKNEVSIV